EVLAALPYERKGERRGYRNGKRERWVSTGLGATVIELPRARLTEGEQDKEWQSRLIERYQRRARSVDSALLGCYLSGANGRRIRGALSPLLRGAPLSKSAISRVVGRLQGLFTEWRQRSLKEEAVVFVYLDAIALRVRIANRVVSAPVLVALGVQADGHKAVLDLELLQSESGQCWGGFVEGLVGRGLKRPRLVIIDGNKGLRAAVDKNWPGIEVQRCTVHKLRNLERHTPRHALEEVKSDYHRIIQAESLEQARKVYREFIVKWKKLAPKVVGSLEEAGEELLTFYGFPNSQWKSLRTTNAIERLNGEFRRRVKTQGSLPSAQAAEFLLFGLTISGQIQMRRIDGWRDLKQMTLSKAA
ncbi:MAG TPA: IS256 family transposase, partial [Candidatus Acidoferrum sp.]|nr:IS256 family transposase [Candidatus Acidoferrum sp.]